MIEDNKGSIIGNHARKGILMRTKYKNFWGVKTLMVLAVLLIIVGVIFYRKEKVDYTGVPDMVSSFSSNNDYYLMIVANSRGISDNEDFAKKVLSRDEVQINIDLKSGGCKASAWGCGLTYDYVKINGDYRT